MKYRIYIFIISLLAVWSCVPDIRELYGQDDECFILTFYNVEMPSKAGEDQASEPGKDPGTETERLINRLDIFLYPKGQSDALCVFYKQVSGLSDIGTSTVPVYVSKDIVNELFPTSNECDVYVVANLPSSVTFDGDEKLDEIKKKSILTDDFSMVVGFDGSYSAPDNFLMSGFGTATRDGDTIGGNIPLIRAASKVTITLNIPEFLNVDAVTDNPDGVDDVVQEEKWYPYLTQEGEPESGVQTMHIGFHKGLKRTYVGHDEANDISKADKAKDVFATQYTERFSYKGTYPIEINPQTGKEPAEGEPRKYYKYECEAIYYTYAFAWDPKNDVDAPYFTLMVPWKRKEDGVRYQTYYYQFTPNPLGSDMKRNSWYDITITVGVLGSRTYNTPVTLGGDALTFYVQDWSSNV